VRLSRGHGAVESSLLGDVDSQTEETRRALEKNGLQVSVKSV
jgi:hypothetical protein